MVDWAGTENLKLINNFKYTYRGKTDKMTIDIGIAFGRENQSQRVFENKYRSSAQS